MPVRSDGIRDRRKLYRNPPSHLGNQGKPPSTWRTSFLRPLPRRGRAFVLLRSHHAPFFGGNPFTPKLRGCTAIPLPAHATCGRDKGRPRRVRLGGGALAVESAGHQWKRVERTAIRAALSGEDRATTASARAARATAEKLAPERRAAPVRVAGSRGGVIAQRARAAWNMITARPRPLPPRDLVRWERRPAVPALIWSSQRPARVCSRQRTGPWHKPGRSTRRPTRKRKAPRYRPPDLQPARRVW